MKVLNIHTREIRATKAEIVALFATLASKNDQMLATDKWPAMRLDKGLAVGSKGGHGAIRYTVSQYKADEFIQFEFSRPVGFNGFHKFEITAIDPNVTELKHTIDMNTTGLATPLWTLAIRWLHDAYIEDAFDKVENQFVDNQKISKWNLWVRFLKSSLEAKTSFG